MDLRTLLADLKRRHVFRVAWLYGVVAFVVLQAAELLFPALLVPDWAFRTLVIFALAGFPIALVLAWAYDITPAGVRRTDSDDEQAAAGGAVEAAPMPAGRFDHNKLAYVGVGILVALVGLGLGAPYLGVSEGGLTDVATADLNRSIAVLPFSSLSTEEGNDVFADGLTEDILSALSNVPGLHVMSRTTAMSYRNTTKTVREIGREQGVGTVLTGTVRRVGTRVRITVQLADARTDENLWAETFDRELSDVLKLQAEVAQYIAAALQARLSPEDEAAAERRLQAYHYAVKGREYFLRGGAQHIETAVGIYEDALLLDPGSPAALAGLAEALVARAWYAGPQWVDSAEAAARAALGADDRLAAAHGALGRVRLAQGRPGEALAALEQAVQIDPKDPWLHLGLSQARREMGELVPALAAAEMAWAALPADGRYAAAIAEVALALGDTARARRHARAALEADRVEPLAYRTLALLALAEGQASAAAAAVSGLLRTGGNELAVLRAAGELELRLGQEEIALAHLEAVLSAVPEGEGRPTLELALLLRRLGEPARADTLLEETIEGLAARVQGGDRSGGTLHRLARAEAAAGRTDEALAHLGEAVDRGFRGRILVELDPAFEEVRRRAAYGALRARL